MANNEMLIAVAALVFCMCVSSAVGLLIYRNENAKSKVKDWFGITDDTGNTGNTGNTGDTGNTGNDTGNTNDDKDKEDDKDKDKDKDEDDEIKDGDGTPVQNAKQAFCPQPYMKGYLKWSANGKEARCCAGASSRWRDCEQALRHPRWAPHNTDASYMRIYNWQRKWEVNLKAYHDKPLSRNGSTVPQYSFDCPCQPSQATGNWFSVRSRNESTKRYWNNCFTRRTTASDDRKQVACSEAPAAYTSRNLT
jgi:hypothetical protein